MAGKTLVILRRNGFALEQRPWLAPMRSAGRGNKRGDERGPLGRERGPENGGSPTKKQKKWSSCRGTSSADAEIRARAEKKKGRKRSGGEATVLQARHGPSGLLQPIFKHAQSKEEHVRNRLSGASDLGSSTTVSARTGKCVARGGAKKKSSRKSRNQVALDMTLVAQGVAGERRSADEDSLGRSSETNVATLDV